MIKIIIDKTDVNEYNNEYFKTHPRAKNKRIKAPQHPTLNWYNTANNMSVNNVKQEWKKFIVEKLRKDGLCDKIIDYPCYVEYVTYFPTKALHDTDNITPKFIFDGFVEAGLFVGDDSRYINRLEIGVEYDKEDPRIEITITPMRKKEKK